MTVSQNLHHRRAAAAQRRAPAPQLGFDPTAVFGDPTGVFGGLSDLFPNRSTSSSDNLPTSTPSSTASSTASSTSISSTSTSTTPTSTASSTTSTTSATPTITSKTQVTTLPQTAVVTVSVTRSSSSVAAATSSSVSLDSTSGSSGISTGVVVGGIGAGVVAIGVIGFAIAYFLRRARKRENEGQFDSHNFRRSAMLMEDPPTHDDTVTRGFNPRPPTMIERHLASPAPTFGTQYGHPGPGYNHEDEYAGGYSENMAGYGTNFQSFGPGQVMNANNGYPSPITATSAHPMYNGAAYAQSPFSPIGSAPEEYHQNGLARQPSMGSGLNHSSYPEAAPYPVPAPVLTRQGSNNEDNHRQGSPTALKRESAPANDYVDLNRSSVSPYQAAQYVEISRRLNTDVPEGLPTAEIDRELPPVPSKSDVSPFADPSSAPPSPGGQYAVDRREFAREGRPLSGESTHTLEFPVPPSPAHPPSASRYRIDSMPPTLPEIHVESRVSVGNYPVLNRDTYGSQQNATIGGLSTGTGSRFPTTPSPLASSFGFPSPAPDATSFSPTHPKIPTPPSAFSPATPNGGSNFQAKRSSMHSVYDADDAYGGI